MTLKQAVAARKKLAANGRRLTVTNGCFDLLHRGHAEYLMQARSLADALFVLINSDASVRALKGPTRPLNRVADRSFLLACLEFVDGVIVFRSSRCDRELAALKPDVYVKGGDYTVDSMDPLERAALLEAGSEIHFIPFVPGYSATGTMEKEWNKRVQKIYSDMENKNRNVIQCVYEVQDIQKNRNDLDKIWIQLAQAVLKKTGTGDGGHSGPKKLQSTIRRSGCGKEISRHKLPVVDEKIAQKIQIALSSTQSRRADFNKEKKLLIRIQNDLNNDKNGFETRLKKLQDGGTRFIRKKEQSDRSQTDSKTVKI